MASKKTNTEDLNEQESELAIEPEIADKTASESANLPCNANVLAKRNLSSLSL